MRTSISIIAMALLMAVSGNVLAQSGDSKFVDGTHYTSLPKQEPTITNDGTVEVAEIFAYSCPHCMNFEPALERWLPTRPDYITFVRIPAPWGDPISDNHARAFYTAELLGKLDEMHAAFFKEFHERGNRLATEDAMREMFARYGVDAETFDKTFNSFAVHNSLQRARDLMQRYGVMETPMIIVNGKYQSRGVQAGNYGNWFAIIEHLAEREHGSAEN
jgi:thiol:disulfide interchange protein DsbA